MVIGGSEPWTKLSSSRTPPPAGPTRGVKFPLPPFIQSVTWRELKGHPLLPPIHTAVFVGVEVRLQMTDMEVQA